MNINILKIETSTISCSRRARVAMINKIDHPGHMDHAPLAPERRWRAARGHELARQQVGRWRNCSQPLICIDPSDPNGHIQSSAFIDNGLPYEMPMPGPLFPYVVALVAHGLGRRGRRFSVATPHLPASRFAPSAKRRFDRLQRRQRRDPRHHCRRVDRCAEDRDAQRHAGPPPAGVRESSVCDDGAVRRKRTDTPSEPDFESGASTSSATPPPRSEVGQTSGSYERPAPVNLVRGGVR